MNPPTDSKVTDKAIQVVYDKQCPACSLYCELVHSNAGSEEVQLIDARDDGDLMADITSQGLDIDEGMVVKVDGELHFGADAIQVLATKGDHNSLFGRANRLLFKNHRLAHTLYPLLRSVRNLLLKLLRVRRINNLGISGRDKF